MSTAAQALQAQNKQLREENEFLRERHRQMCELMAGEQRPWPRHRIDLQPNEERIVRVLYARGYASKQALHHALYSEDPDGGPAVKIIDVYVCKIRKKHPGLKHELKTVWGRGYELTDKGKQYIDRLTDEAA